MVLYVPQAPISCKIPKIGLLCEGNKNLQNASEWPIQNHFVDFLVLNGPFRTVL